MPRRARLQLRCARTVAGDDGVDGIAHNRRRRAARSDARRVGRGCHAVGPVSASASTTAQPMARQTAPPASASPTSAARATATPVSTSRPTPAAPPLPTAVRIKRVGCYTGPDPGGVLPGTCTTTVTWKKVATKGTEIRVYGVTECLSMTERAGSGSCLVLHTALPASTRKLIARVTASKGTVS